MQKEYTVMEVEEALRNDDLSILLKIQDNFFDIGKARNLIQRYPYHTVSIYAFCEPDVRKNPMVIQAALPGLAKARRMDMLPENIRDNPDIMLRAVKASAEAYFSLPDSLKEDLPFHLKLSEVVDDMLELPISPRILSSAKFIYNCIEGATPTYVKNQILNAEIPTEMKNQILSETRHFMYERSVSMEFIKSQVLKVLEILVMEQAAMEHNLSKNDLSYKFKPSLNLKKELTTENSLFSPFSEKTRSLSKRSKQDQAQE